MNKFKMFIINGWELEDKKELTFIQRLHYITVIPLSLLSLFTLISAIILYYMLGIFVLDGILWIITGKSLYKMFNK
jgi:hypothetical protein